jgi:predicted dehydrogenase
VQFRTPSGITGVFVQSMAAAGEMFSLVRITGSEGAAWIQGEEVWVSDNKGTKHAVPLPADLAYPPPEPFPHPEIMQTAYEFGHSFGTDLHPYTRLFEGMRERIAGRPGPAAPPLATFRDGVAVQAVVDAIKQSSAQRRWVDVDNRI